MIKEAYLQKTSNELFPASNNKIATVYSSLFSRRTFYNLLNRLKNKVKYSMQSVEDSIRKDIPVIPHTHWSTHIFVHARQLILILKILIDPTLALQNHD